MTYKNWTIHTTPTSITAHATDMELMKRAIDRREA